MAKKYYVSGLIKYELMYIRADGLKYFNLGTVLLLQLYTTLQSKSYYTQYNSGQH